MATTTRRVRPKNGGGCLLLLLLIFLAWLLYFVGALTDTWATVPRTVAQWTVIAGALYVGGRAVWRWLVGRRLPVCPHCGAITNPEYRVCRACGRVKHAPS